MEEEMPRQRIHQVISCFTQYGSCGTDYHNSLTSRYVQLSVRLCAYKAGRYCNQHVLVVPHKTYRVYTSHTYPHVDDRFEWDEFTRGQMLAAFSYGYVTTQLIGGRLAELYGVKLVYGLSLVGTAILSLLSPAVARDGRRTDDSDSEMRGVLAAFNLNS